MVTNMEKNEDSLERPYDLQEELTLLDPGHIRLFRDRFEDLNLELEDGRTLGPVMVQRAFPITATDGFVVLKDREGKELGVVQQVSKLDPASRQVLEAELERNYFTPQIIRVDAIKEEFHILKWEVGTDRGPRVFEIRNSRSDIRLLGGGRVLLRDADGNRYEISDYHNLDPVSLALVETQI